MRPLDVKGLKPGDLILVPFMKGKQIARVCECTDAFIRVRKYRVASGTWTQRMHKIEWGTPLGMYDGPKPNERKAAELHREYKLRIKREGKWL